MELSKGQSVRFRDYDDVEKLGFVVETYGTGTGMETNVLLLVPDVDVRLYSRKRIRPPCPPDDDDDDELSRFLNLG